MNKDFTPPAESLELKKLGFDKPCFATYDEDRNFELQDFLQTYETFPSHIVAAPTFSQAFRWFREKYQLFSWVKVKYEYGGYSCGIYITGVRQSDIANGPYNTYEEAELECLKKLIEIVKQNDRSTRME